MVALQGVARMLEVTRSLRLLKNGQSGSSRIGIRREQSRRFTVTRQRIFGVGVVVEWSACPPRASGADAVEQHRGRLVVRVLRHQFAAKCLGQYRLIEPIEQRRCRSGLGGQASNAVKLCACSF
jgi:hypothetical protein